MTHTEVQRPQKALCIKLWSLGLQETLRVQSSHVMYVKLYCLNRAKGMMSELSPSRPLEDVLVDLSTHDGKHVLVYVDHLLGWPQFGTHGSDATSCSTIKLIHRFSFTKVSVPIYLRSEGGPQFSSHEFKAFLKCCGVYHEVSTSHYPQSNDHTETY